MPVKRKQHSTKFKFRVALESMKGQKTVSQIAQEYGVHPSRIHAWKKQLQEEGDSLFERKNQSQQNENHEQEVSELFEQIGKVHHINVVLARQGPQREQAFFDLF